MSIRGAFVKIKLRKTPASCDEVDAQHKGVDAASQAQNAEKLGQA
jgi:hypothetical protein